jgi:hypothetical protein
MPYRRPTTRGAIGCLGVDRPWGAFGGFRDYKLLVMLIFNIVRLIVSLTCGRRRSLARPNPTHRRGTCSVAPCHSARLGEGQEWISWWGRGGVQRLNYQIRLKPTPEGRKVGYASSDTLSDPLDPLLNGIPTRGLHQVSAQSDCARLRNCNFRPSQQRHTTTHRHESRKAGKTIVRCN